MSNTSSEAKLQNVASNSIDLSVHTDSPGSVVLSQIYYPGWQVSVDGIRAPFLQTDYTLAGVFVKEGSHSVRFLYRPASLRIGMAITLGTILIVAAVTVFTRRRNAGLKMANGSGHMGKDPV
jgi:uncharacterized membrane protein YfhO